MMQGVCVYVREREREKEMAGWGTQAWLGRSRNVLSKEILWVRKSSWVLTLSCVLPAKSPLIDLHDHQMLFPSSLPF